MSGYTVLLVLLVPSVPVYATIFTPFKLILAKSGILSRMVLKSRASMLPVTVRLVTVAAYALVMEANVPGIVTAKVLVTCAETLNVVSTTIIRDKSFFIVIIVFRENE